MDKIVLDNTVSLWHTAGWPSICAAFADISPYMRYLYIGFFNKKT